MNRSWTGSGMFLSAVIVAIVCLIRPSTVMRRPVLRDLIFFLLALLVCTAVIHYRTIYFWHAAGY